MYKHRRFASAIPWFASLYCLNAISRCKIIYNDSQGLRVLNTADYLPATWYKRNYKMEKCSNLFRATIQWAWPDGCKIVQFVFHNNVIYWLKHGLYYLWQFSHFFSTMPNTIYKSQGFEGEHIIVIPKTAIAQSLQLPLIHSLFIAKMGYYPRAKNHYFQRPNGIAQVVLIYCIQGSGWIQLKGERMEIMAGQVFLLPQALPHSYGANKDNPWSIYWMHLSGKQCNETVTAVMGDIKKGIGPVTIRFAETRNQLFQQIHTIFLKGYSASNLIYANLLLPYYLSSFVLPDAFQPQAISLPTKEATDKAIHYMQQHLAQPLTLDNIAQAAHLSVSFFCRKFKADTGYTPIEYFNHLRIQQACQLLHFSQLRINEVASRIGIDDPFYFSRLFKQQIGMSPAAYRKMEGSKGSD